MNSNRKIELGLFDLLKDIGPLMERTASQNKDAKSSLTILDIRDKLTVFCKNFLIQFFYVGYGYLIDGINTTTMKKIEKFFSFNLDKPPKMIDMVSKYIKIHTDIMADPYTREIRISKKLYCSFLPELFGTFQKEAKEVIYNFEEVTEKIMRTMTDIEETCGRIT